jgi:hypothetical protein
MQKAEVCHRKVLLCEPFVGSFLRTALALAAERSRSTIGSTQRRLHYVLSSLCWEVQLLASRLVVGFASRRAGLCPLHDAMSQTLFCHHRISLLRECALIVLVWMLSCKTWKHEAHTLPTPARMRCTERARVPPRLLRNNRSSSSSRNRSSNGKDSRHNLHQARRRFALFGWRRQGGCFCMRKAQLTALTYCVTLSTARVVEFSWCLVGSRS